ncbi:MAG: hypothetical protein ACUVUG_04480 [Candidatus Aminicenantia bacterium]
MNVRWSFFLIIVIVCAVLAYLFVFTPQWLKRVPLIENVSQFFQPVKPEELKTSIELFDIDTYWGEKYVRPWETVLVPVISFKVKNVGQKPLQYVSFNAVFRFKGDEQALGDCYLSVFRTPLESNQVSERITLKSNYGYKASSKSAFINNPAWKPTIVDIYVRSKGSGFAYIGRFNINKKIEGINLSKEDKVEIVSQ